MISFFSAVKMKTKMQFNYPVKTGDFFIYKNHGKRGEALKRL